MLGLRERTTNNVDKLSQIERFWQIFIGTGFRSADCGHESILRAHHHDRQIRAHLLDARKQIKGILVRHVDVCDDQITITSGYPAPERCCIGRHPNIIACTRQCLIKHRTDCSIVICDENRTCRTSGNHALSPVFADIFELFELVLSAELFHAGMSMRNVVRDGWLSHSITPP
ncbi:hypothetical protein D3C80_1133510 [compost metagenome]